jgi:hypothetical protein
MREGVSLDTLDDIYVSCIPHSDPTLPADKNNIIRVHPVNGNLIFPGDPLDTCAPDRLISSHVNFDQQLHRSCRGTKSLHSKVHYCRSMKHVDQINKGRLSDNKINGKSVVKSCVKFAEVSSTDVGCCKAIASADLSKAWSPQLASLVTGFHYHEGSIVYDKAINTEVLAIPSQFFIHTLQVMPNDKWLRFKSGTWVYLNKFFPDNVDDVVWSSNGIVDPANNPHTGIEVFDILSSGHLENLKISFTFKMKCYIEGCHCQKKLVLLKTQEKVNNALKAVGHDLEATLGPYLFFETRPSNMIGNTIPSHCHAMDATGYKGNLNFDPYDPGEKKTKTFEASKPKAKAAHLLQQSKLCASRIDLNTLPCHLQPPNYLLGVYGQQESAPKGSGSPSESHAMHNYTVGAASGIGDSDRNASHGQVCAARTKELHAYDISAAPWLDGTERDSLSTVDIWKRLIKYNNETYDPAVANVTGFYEKIGLVPGWLQAAHEGPFDHREYTVGIGFDMMSVWSCARYASGLISMDGTMFGDSPQPGSEQYHKTVIVLKFGYLTCFIFKFYDVNELRGTSGPKGADAHIWVHHPSKSGVPEVVLTMALQELFGKLNKCVSLISVEGRQDVITPKATMSDHGKVELLCLARLWPTAIRLLERWHTNQIIDKFVLWMSKSEEFSADFRHEFRNVFANFMTASTATKAEKFATDGREMFERLIDKSKFPVTSTDKDVKTKDSVSTKFKNVVETYVLQLASVVCDYGRHLIGEAGVFNAMNNGPTIEGDNSRQKNVKNIGAIKKHSDLILKQVCDSRIVDNNTTVNSMNTVFRDMADRAEKNKKRSSPLPDEDTTDFGKARKGVNFYKKRVQNEKSGLGQMQLAAKRHRSDILLGEQTACSTINQLILINCACHGKSAFETSVTSALKRFTKQFANGCSVPTLTFDDEGALEMASCAFAQIATSEIVDAKHAWLSELIRTIACNECGLDGAEVNTLFFSCEHSAFSGDSFQFSGEDRISPSVLKMYLRIKNGTVADKMKLSPLVFLVVEIDLTKEQSGLTFYANSVHWEHDSTTGETHERFAVSASTRRIIADRLSSHMRVTPPSDLFTYATDSKVKDQGVREARLRLEINRLRIQLKGKIYFASEYFYVIIDVVCITTTIKKGVDSIQCCLTRLDTEEGSVLKSIPLLKTAAKQLVASWNSGSISSDTDQPVVGISKVLSQIKDGSTFVTLDKKRPLEMQEENPVAAHVVKKSKEEVHQYTTVLCPTGKNADTTFWTLIGHKFIDKEKGGVDEHKTFVIKNVCKMKGCVFLMFEYAELGIQKDGECQYVGASEAITADWAEWVPE